MHFCAGACECVHMCAHGSTAICVRVCMWMCMFHVHACHEGWKGRTCQLQQFPLSLKFTPHTFHTLSGHENTCPQWAGEVEGEESRRAYSCDGGELIVSVAAVTCHVFKRLSNFEHMFATCLITCLHECPLKWESYIVTLCLIRCTQSTQSNYRRM